MGVPGVVTENMVELYDVMQTSLDLASTASDHTHSPDSAIAHSRVFLAVRIVPHLQKAATTSMSHSALSRSR